MSHIKCSNVSSLRFNTLCKLLHDKKDLEFYCSRCLLGELPPFDTDTEDGQIDIPDITTDFDQLQQLSTDKSLDI